MLEKYFNYILGEISEVELVLFVAVNDEKLFDGAQVPTSLLDGAQVPTSGSSVALACLPGDRPCDGGFLLLPNVPG